MALAIKKYPLKLPWYPLQPVMYCHVLQQNGYHKYTKYPGAFFHSNRRDKTRKEAQDEEGLSAAAPWSAAVPAAPGFRAAHRLQRRRPPYPAAFQLLLRHNACVSTNIVSQQILRFNKDRKRKHCVSTFIIHHSYLS